MLDENLLKYYPTFNPTWVQSYTKAVDIMDPVGKNTYNLQYNHSMIDDDNVNDSIKVKILYNELMTLKNELSETERLLRNEIVHFKDDYRRLKEENKELSNEIASIKQFLYFG